MLKNQLIHQESGTTNLQNITSKPVPLLLKPVLWFQLSVCGSGLRDPIAYSLLGGGVPYPEHRLNWYLDSVPMFKFLCFPSVMVFVPSFSPLQDSSGFLAFQNILPVSSLFSSLMPPLRPFLCIQPTPSSVYSPIDRQPEVW